ncbi:hypothetical protein [Rhodococcus sp. NPDC058521]|uniref:hypothetical protein n=1 Tax=Rhodococcus sp. NPDC058521 TaxID=3346536 RepID=UPI00364852EB
MSPPEPTNDVESEHACPDTTAHCHAGALSALGAATALASPVTADPIGPVIGPAPIPVHQIPATGLWVDGLPVPGAYSGSVLAQTTAVPGETRFSTAFSPDVCGTTAGGAMLQINFQNLGTGDHGSMLLKACNYFPDPAPAHASVRTGTGPVVFSVSVASANLALNKGQPTLPGTGGFVAP